MPYNEYSQTLPDDAARRQMAGLWQRAALRLELPWVRGADDAGERDEKLQYEQLGAVIARYSNAVLACWDGQGEWDSLPDAKAQRAAQGGTAHVVHMIRTGTVVPSLRETGVLSVGWTFRLGSADARPVLRMAAGRCKSGPSREPVGSLHCYGAGREAPVSVTREEAVATVFRHLEGLRDVNRLLASNVASNDKRELDRQQAAGYLFPDAGLQALPAGTMEAGWLRAMFAAVDTEALRQQKAIYRAQMVLLTTLPVGVYFYERYAHDQSWQLLALYLAVVLGAFLFYLGPVRLKAWQNWFQDCRALAEALRVQFFWGLAKLPDSVVEHYLSHHRGELRWIREALRGSALWSLALALKLPEPQKGLVKTHWIDDQRNFFIGQGLATDTPAEDWGWWRRLSSQALQKCCLIFEAQPSTKKAGKAGQHRWKHERCNTLATAFYGFGIVIAATLLIISLLNGSEHGDHAPDFWVLLIGCLPALAAAWTIYAETQAFEAQAHEYTRMGQVFGVGGRLIDTSSPEAYASIVRELGEEALAENAGWLLTHRGRPIEVIKGG